MVSAPLVATDTGSIEWIFLNYRQASYKAVVFTEKNITYKKKNNKSLNELNKSAPIQ